MKELKGRHVLGIFIAFFGVMFAVNFTFMSYAFSTFTGEDRPRPYVAGLEYNKTLKARSEQKAHGWQATIDAARASGDVVVKVSIVDRHGAPQDGLEVTLVFRRPTNAALDKTYPLTQAGNGLYRATAPAIAPGQWDLVVQSTLPDGTAFEAQRRVLLP